MRNTNKHFARFRFTLIELLVVIGIIAILAAMLLPALSRAREKARVAICLANHKEMVMAMAMYADENEDFAVSHNGYGGWAGTKGWHGWSPSPPYLLNPYFTGESAAVGVTTCPSDKGDPHTGTDHIARSFGNSYISAYASGGHVNIGWSTNNPWATSSATGLKFTRFAQPSYKIAIYTSMWNNNRDWADPQTRWHALNFNNSRIPCSFVDGHAENFDIWWRPSNVRPPFDAGYDGSGNIRTQIDRDGYY